MESGESHLGDNTKGLSEEEARRLYPGREGRKLAMIEEALVPGHSMCGVRLGDSESTVIEVLGDPISSRGEAPLLFLEYTSFTVALLNQPVHMLVAELSFGGQTPEGIAVGMPWRDVAEALEDVEFDEQESLWFSPSHPGVWYEIARPANGLEQPLDPPYVPELHEVSEPHQAIVRRIYVMT